MKTYCGIYLVYTLDNISPVDCDVIVTICTALLVLWRKINKNQNVDRLF
jgi:hypothetical protein